MEPITSLKAAVLPITKLVVENAEGLKEYALVLDINAIAKAEKEMGRDLSKMANWQNLGAADLSVILWAALDRFHPEVTIRDVRGWLAPVQTSQLYTMLLEQCWPGIIERIDKFVADEKSKAAAPSGEPPPSSPAP